MRKSVFITLALVFTIVFAACAPAAEPTASPVPPTAPAQPTQTPEPTSTKTNLVQAAPTATEEEGFLPWAECVEPTQEVDLVQTSASNTCVAMIAGSPKGVWRDNVATGITLDTPTAIESIGCHFDRHPDSQVQGKPGYFELTLDQQMQVLRLIQGGYNLRGADFPALNWRPNLSGDSTYEVESEWKQPVEPMDSITPQRAIAGMQVWVNPDLDFSPLYCKPE